MHSRSGGTVCWTGCPRNGPHGWRCRTFRAMRPACPMTRPTRSTSLPRATANVERLRRGGVRALEFAGMAAYVARQAIKREKNSAHGTHQSASIHSAGPRRGGQGDLADAPRGAADHGHGPDHGGADGRVLCAGRSGYPQRFAGYPVPVRLKTKKILRWPLNPRAITGNWRHTSEHGARRIRLRADFCFEDFG